MKIVNTIAHILGIYFSYAALCVILFAAFKIILPFPKALDSNLFTSVGTLIGLLLLSIFCFLTKKTFELNFIFGIIYLVLWLGTIMKIVFFTW